MDDILDLSLESSYLSKELGNALKSTHPNASWAVFRQIALLKEALESYRLTRPLYGYKGDR